MKKIAAAALAATMTLSVAAVPAEAASNKMRGNYCVIQLDGDRVREVPRSVIRNDKDFAQFNSENVSMLRTSSDLGEAFGSSDPETMAAANNAEAVQACINGQNYQSQEMTTLKQVGIILGVVLPLLAAIGSVAAPAIQQFLPF